MEYRVSYSGDELYHWGIKGMRWGVRRYQNADGTWTAAGKRKRRSEPSSDAQKRAARKNEIKNLKSKSELDTAKASYKVTKALNKQAVKEARGDKPTIRDRLKARKTAKKEESTEDIIRSGNAAKIEKNKSKMTDDELRQAITRMQLDNQLSAVQAQKRQQGVDTYKRFADVVGTTANMTKNGIDIYNNVAKIMNTFGVGGNSDRKIIGEKSSGEDAMAKRLKAAQVRLAEANAERGELTLQTLRNEQKKKQTNSGTNESSSSNTSSSTSSRPATTSEIRSTTSSTSSIASSSASRQQSSNRSESSSGSGRPGSNSLLGALRVINHNKMELRATEARVRSSYGVNSEQYKEVKAAREATERIADLRALEYRTNRSTNLSDTAASNARKEVDRLLSQERTRGTFKALQTVPSIMDRYKDLDDD